MWTVGGHESPLQLRMRTVRGPDACGRGLSADVKFVDPHTSAAQAPVAGHGPGHGLCTPDINGASLGFAYDRTTAVRHRPISWDEHFVSVLVVLPTPTLQPQDVRWVSAAGCGGCGFRIQVPIELCVLYRNQPNSQFYGRDIFHRIWRRPWKLPRNSMICCEFLPI